MGTGLQHVYLLSCYCLLATLTSSNLSMNVIRWRCKDHFHELKKSSQQWPNTTALILLQIISQSWGNLLYLRWPLFAFDDPSGPIINMANERPVFLLPTPCPCQEHPDFYHHLKCVYTPAGALSATLSSITSMLINCKQLWSHPEEASYFFRVYLQPKQRWQSFHSLSRVLADLMWDATAFFVTLLCLRRLHFTGEQVWKCVTEIRARARRAGARRPNQAADTSSCICIVFSRLDKWHKFVKCLISAQTSDEKYSPMFQTICVKKLVKAQWVSLAMTPMTHRETRMPPPFSGSRCALGSPSGETLPPQRVRAVQIYSSQACSSLWIFPWESMTLPRPTASDTPTCERVFPRHWSTP